MPKYTQADAAIRYVRVELVVPGTFGPKDGDIFLTIPGFGHEIRQSTASAVLTLTAEDSAILRANLIEFIAAHHGTGCSVVRSVVYNNQCKGVHGLVESAFGAGEERISYNMKEAARRLGISYSYMKELVYLGRIQRENGRIAAKELEKFLGLRRTRHRG